MGFVLALLLASAGTAHADPAQDVTDLPFIRVGFYQAVENSSATEALAAYIEKNYGVLPKSFPPVVQAYYASVEGLKGKHAKDLFSKLGHVGKAVDLFRDLVETNPDNVEIRFLRFALFSQLPFFFGVRGYVSTDLAALVDQLEMQRYDDVPPDIQHAIAVYLLANAELDRGRRARVQKLESDIRPLPRGEPEQGEKGGLYGEGGGGQP
jgi:hypothetical protein